MFPTLNFPEFTFKIQKKGDIFQVWCPLRKKMLRLTPEEWVRQHVIQCLITEKNYPSGLVVSEMSIKVNQLNRRCDLVVFNRLQQPQLIVECKAPDIPITEKTLHQVAQYNFKLRVEYLLLTNGFQHIICKINHNENKLEYLPNIPNWENLIDNKH